MLNLGCTKAISGPVTWELSPEAQLTYATLLLDQSIRQNDRVGVLEAAEIFLQVDNRMQPFVDATAWLIINKQPVAARELLQKVISKYPQDLGLRLLLAEAWLESNDPEAAVQVLLEFQKTAPDSDLVRQELAILQVKAGHFVEANRIFKSLPQRLRTTYVRFCHAQALVALNDLAAAKTQLRLVLEDNTEFLEAWYELAKILEQEKDFKEARKIYQSLIEQEPDNMELWSRSIGLELQVKRPKDALSQVQKGPQSFGFRLSVASRFIELQYYTEAKEILTAMQTEPNVPEEVYFFLAALVFEAENDVDQAMELLNKIAPTNRYYSKALSLKIQILYNQDQKDKALELIQSSRASSPLDQDLFLMEVQFYLNQEQYQDALAVLEAGLTSWPNDEPLLFMRGSLLDSLGRKDEALEYILGLWKNGHSTPQILNYIGYAYAEKGTNLKLALELIQQALAKSPDKAYILDSLAWVQYKLGEFQNAWKNIKQAVKLETNDPTIWEHYGDIAIQLGYQQEARKAWKKALTFNPEQAESIQAKLRNIEK